MLERLFVGGTEEEETRIRRHMKGHFLKSEVFEIHSLV